MYMKKIEFIVLTLATAVFLTVFYACIFFIQDVILGIATGFIAGYIVTVAVIALSMITFIIWEDVKNW